MASYFSAATGSADLGLLPATQRSATELGRLASEAEADIIARYTDYIAPASYRGAADLADPGRARSPLVYRSSRYTATADGLRGVFLDGYTVDADDCTSEPFKDAMKRAVAAVVSWRLDQTTRNLAAISVSGHAGMNSSITYNTDHADPWPAGWDRWLRPYDTRPPNYAI